MSAPDIDATVTRCRELAEFMRKQGAVTGAEAFEEAAAALLALRAERDALREAGNGLLSALHSHGDHSADPSIGDYEPECDVCYAMKRLRAALAPAEQPKEGT